MITAGWYLLKVSICLLVLYIPYLILFRKNTFFGANRLYLLLTLIFSFVIPTLEISQSTAVYSIVAESTPGTSLSHYYDDFNSIEAVYHEVNYPLILSWVYLAGVLVFTIRLGFSVVSILKIKRGADIEKIDRFSILRVDSTEPFSFFNLIFLPKTEINPLIIQHEKIHIKQFHWMDVVLVEVAAILLWFNPVMIPFKRSLKLQHEYLADEQTIKGDVQPDMVQEIFARYHSSVLLTKGENFGHALYESLSVGRPVITSYFTAWNQLEDKKAGWNVDISADNEIAKIITEVYNLDQPAYDLYCVGAYGLANEYYLHGFDMLSYKKMFIK